MYLLQDKGNCNITKDMYIDKEMLVVFLLERSFHLIDKSIAESVEVALILDALLRNCKKEEFDILDMEN